MAPDRVSTLIVACCILLNLAVKLREPEPEDFDMDDEGCAAHLHTQWHGLETGNAVREHAAYNLFKLGNVHRVTWSMLYFFTTRGNLWWWQFFSFKKVRMADIFYAQLIVFIICMLNYKAIALPFSRVSVFAIGCKHLQEIVTLTVGFLQ